MSEWKGPWKCEKCGLDYLNITNNILHGKCQLHCQGRLLPYERRAADERVRELVDALEKAVEIIKTWHNMGQGSPLVSVAWQTYCEHAPEMKPIAAALRKHGKE